MTQIETIIAEIERLKADYVPKVNTEYRDFAKLLLDIVVDSINSLPAEQPSEELENAYDEYYDKTWDEHGGKAMVIDRCHDIWYPSSATQDFYKAGANWQKEQMMKSAIDAKIVNDEMSGCVVDCEQGCLVLEPHRYAIGQKLKLLIIKEDEQ